ncbi:glycerol-3-phosphate dehydrogenase subunit GlpB [Halobium salinum]|uniref:Glycerol-3-phosphate dehydrogenase subunit GlpB n=1 Tax=Halobium salinum TaxID=1364940 RepID=A0ABD5P7V1_9EURY|nr:glycerol-3-phosphate dehydrogenase subunit GlpB [Halobium salinum]
MPIREDVLVVGGGMAGATAALSAARTGASVRLVSYRKPTFRQASGLVDLLGYVPERTDGDTSGDVEGGTDGSGSDTGGRSSGPVANPYDALSVLPDDHPYSVVGDDAVREAFDLFDEVAGDLYVGSHTDANALLPTHGGTVKPTARYPVSAAAGVASDDRSMLLVGFEGLTDFDAPLAAQHLRAAGVPFDVEGVQVRFPIRFRADAKVTRYARALDRDEEAARRRLVSRLEDHVESSGAERVGFPALLGDEQPATVREDLADRLGVDVFEVPMGPPSLPGMRLEDRLYAALDEAGVRMTTGNPVVDYEGEETDEDAGSVRINAVLVDHKNNRVPYHAEQFVLATGGLVGKGITSSRERVMEPVFDCYVPHSEDRYDWSRADAFGDHPFARFGVVPDGELRPTTADGEAQFENLRAAGGVLGGADFAAEKSGSGVSLATGHVAGRTAGESV